MDGIMELLAERGKTHGAFVDHARCTQRLMGVIAEEVAERYERGQPDLSMEQHETLHMICHKVGRIIAGDADFADHWDDIAGYAKLCSKPAVLEQHQGEEVPATSWPYPQDDPCPLDGRNCAHDHGPTVTPTTWWGAYTPSVDHPAFGEGDETPMLPPGAYNVTPGAAPKHIHRWRALDDMMVCRSHGCGATRPIVDQEPGQYALDLDRKFPCVCRDMDRCKIDNGTPIGNNVFCCKGEEGR